MTGPGTNSYLLGQGAGVVLVDPGPDDPSHVAALLAALGPAEAVGAIIVTHPHRDHSAAARRLSALTGAPVLAFGTAEAGRSPLMQHLAEAGLQGGGEGVDAGFRPDRLIADDEVLPCPGASLRVIHTPGHMGSHVCLGFGDILLSGDHAMGWASSLISPPDGDMRAYRTSLALLMAQDWRLMLPGHGAPVAAVQARLRSLQDHRTQREAEILAALRTGPATAAGLTRQIYRDTDPALLGAAERNVLAHLVDLWDRNVVAWPQTPQADSVFHLTGATA
ncbi:MAG: MBL fold metallo-hydrolase [Rhodobacteraceae bacterium]|nr:MBL fold metallo-hydrolase [Paracoccaceae bacterium]